MTDASRSRTLARLQIVAAAVLFSTGGAAIKATDLDGWQVAGSRAGIAALFLLLAAPSARRGWSSRTVPVAMVFGATLFLFVMANKSTTAANTIFLQSTSPLYLLLLSPWLLKESIRRREVIMLALIAAGMSLFFVGIEPPQVSAPAPMRGNALAAGAGFAWALTVIGLRGLGRRIRGGVEGAMPAVVLGNALVFALCLPRIGGMAGISLRDAGIVAFLGVVQIGVAYIFLTSGIRRIPAFEAALLLMVEPVLSPLWAWLVHGETVGSWALAGGALILAATAAPALYDALRSAPVESLEP